MRIAMLAWESLHSIAVGGVAQHVTELAAALRRKGHDVHVFTRLAPGQSDYECVDGVHYYRCDYKGDKEFVDDVNNMCRAFVHRLFGVEDSTGRPFDIVHAHDWLAANAMIWVKKGRERRGVFTIHATEYGRSGNVFHNGRSARIREQERAGTHWADHVIAVSHTTRREVQWMYETPDDRITTIYNGVARHRFDRRVDPDKTRRAHDIGPLDPVVLFCGRLDYQKGPDILLEAFPSVRNDYPNAKLVFLGDGGMRPHLEHRARDLGVAHATRFLGYRGGEHVVDVFKIADAVVAPSRNEPFGIVVLEAWSAGKPVVVTHNGGPGEYVWHEVNGLRVFDNPNSIAWGIHQLFGDFDHARWMGANGRRAVDKGFTWDLVADQTWAVYDPSRAGSVTPSMQSLSSERLTVDISALRGGAKQTSSHPTPAVATGASTGDGAHAGATRTVVHVHDPAHVTCDAADAATETAATTHETDDAHANPPAYTEIELSIVTPGQHDGATTHLSVCEEVLRARCCQTRRSQRGLIIAGEWRTVFDAMREACQRVHQSAGGRVSTRLTLAPNNGHGAPPSDASTPGTARGTAQIEVSA